MVSSVFWLNVWSNSKLKLRNWKEKSD